MRSEVLELFDSIFDVLKPTVEDNGISDAEIDVLIAERQEARRSRGISSARMRFARNCWSAA